MKKIKKIFAIFLCIVLVIVNMPGEILAAKSSTRTLKYHFKGMTTEEDKKIIIENIYVRNATTGEITYLTEDNVQISTEGQYAGCFMFAFTIGTNEKAQMLNKQGAIISENADTNSVIYYYPMNYCKLSVDGVIVDTLYMYSMGLKLPYSGKEPMFQKSGYYLEGWYSNESEYARRVADAEYGNVGWYNGILYARWNEHIHDWTSELSGDEVAHWYECEGLGTCDIVNNEEKNGYEEHDFSSENEVINNPTCTDEGSERIYCSKDGCNAYKEEKI